MKNNIWMRTRGLFVLFMTLCLAACGNKTKTDPNIPHSKTTSSITMVGSTSMEKLANALAESYSEIVPEITVYAEFIGSGAGIEAVNNQTADIGNSSRNLKEEEKAAGAVENVVAIDGIAVITAASHLVTELTKDELIDIYTGNITNWNELGGDSTPIVVIGREAGSGTRGAFEEILDIEGECRYANELDNTGAVIAKVAATKGAIGYVSLDVLDDSVRALGIDGVDATTENIIAGNYILSRPFVMATKGAISEQNQSIQDFFSYLYSEEGRKVIESVGLIPVEAKEM